MTKPKIILTSSYQERLRDIEDFIWKSSMNNTVGIDAFIIAHDNALEFLRDNPETLEINRGHLVTDATVCFSKTL
jgi:hypothetical protein